MKSWYTYSAIILLYLEVDKWTSWQQDTQKKIIIKLKIHLTILFFFWLQIYLNFNTWSTTQQMILSLTWLR